MTYLIEGNSLVDVLCSQFECSDFECGCFSDASKCGGQLCNTRCNHCEGFCGGQVCYPAQVMPLVEE
ncbi:hypothetical protein PRVXT_002357 [Proteinivorax tanatarense]|uniref:Uncharacterized protein n=1 Tax=Proteinivorax tanatarense TaxID=1260629 RepID=A0AAU7VJM8_9FIRM